MLKLLFFLPLVHRIGRTGRSGKTGIATTFINKGCGKEKWKIETQAGFWAQDDANSHTLSRSLHELHTFILKLTLKDACPLPHADESVLMDLKALLIEAKQKVPPVLQVLQSGDETMLDIGGELFHKKMPLRLHLCLQPFFFSLYFCSFFSFLNFHRREGLHILRWSGSSYHRLSKAGGHADQTGHQHRTERLPGS